MKVEVLSLGGSLIFKDGKVNYAYIRQVKKLLQSYKDRKFVVVLGGGFIARIYIDALEKFGIHQDFMSHFGVAITRTNARMLANAFGVHSNVHYLPTSLVDVKNFLGKHKIVCCGGLRYERDNTSDGTAAHIANYLGTRFINITNVKGLYDKNPREHKNARFIPTISYDNFDTMVSKMKYHPGQHFVLDQHASRVIKKHKVPTYIISDDLKNLKNILDGKKFVGTTIC